MEKEKLVFTKEYKGYSCNAWYLEKPNHAHALIEISKNDKVIRSFTFPVYKVYNIYAHFEDIVHTEMYNSIPPFVRNPRHSNGYQMASWTGL
jgi:hypothetical protein